MQSLTDRMDIGIPGSARASRAGDRALAVAPFILEKNFGEGAEMCTRGRVRSPDHPRPILGVMLLSVRRPTVRKKWTA
jgi:hypothetical protein